MLKSRVQRMILCAALLVSSKAGALDTDISDSSGPYCGIYAIYGAAKILKHNINLQDLLKPQYISTDRGSSLGDLKQAAQDIGLQATIVGNMALQDLKKSNLPVILHVKDPETPADFEHFILCLAHDDESAYVLDPPRPLVTKPYTHLLPYWDGYGLVVSTQPIDLGRFCAPSRRQRAAIIALLVAGVFVLRRVYGRFSNASHTRPKHVFLSSMGRAAILVLLVAGAAILYHSIADIGLIANNECSSQIMAANASSFLPKVTVSKARRLVNKPGTVFIDARLSPDFQLGHIDGAINIPVNVSDGGLAGLLAGIPNSAKCIIYCQSTHCGFAGAICTRLANKGYINLAILQGGWLAWSDTQ